MYKLLFVDQFTDHVLLQESYSDLNSIHQVMKSVIDHKFEDYDFTFFDHEGSLLNAKYLSHKICRIKDEVVYLCYCKFSLVEDNSEQPLLTNQYLS